MNRNAGKTKSAQKANVRAVEMLKTVTLGGENSVHIAGVTGSSPVSPTIKNPIKSMFLKCGVTMRRGSYVPIPAAVKRSSEINGMSALTLAFGAFDTVRVIPATPSLWRTEK
jgi:hypothetical protein